MSIKEDNLIFDLDGTLFDSAPEILKCLKKVFLVNKLESKNDFDESIIGPPLRETLKSLVQKHTVIKNAELQGAMIGNHVVYDGSFNFVSIGDYTELS